jgi:hypothetical protein
VNEFAALPSTTGLLAETKAFNRVSGQTGVPDPISPSGGQAAARESARSSAGRFNRRIPWTVIGSIAGTRALNKAVDILAGIIERKLTGGNDDHKKTVKILGPDGRVVIEVIATPEKKKLK